MGYAGGFHFLFPIKSETLKIRGNCYISATLAATPNNGVVNNANNSKDFLEVDGEIMELLPSASFRVRLQNGHEILGHLSGRMRMHRIRLLPGDRVKVQMTPYDLTKGRITYRY